MTDSYMKKRLYITLYKDELEILKKLSKKHERSRSAMIGKMIKEYEK